MELQPIGEPQPDPVERSGRGRGLSGALAAAAVGALIIAMTIMSTGDDAVELDEALAADSPVLVTATPVITPTPEPTTRPVFGSTFATTVPSPPTVVPTPGFAQALSSVGLDTGWIGTAGGDGVRMLSLDTGETIRVLVTPDVLFTAPPGALTTSGLLVRDWNGPSAGRWIMHYWDGRLPVPVDVASGMTVLMVIDDEAQGPLAIIGPDGSVRVDGASAVETRDDFEALAVNTGERQVIGLSPALATDLAASPRFGTAFADRLTQLSVSVADRLYRWTWDDGLEEFGVGTILARSANALLIQRCAGPSSCELEVIDNAGSVRGSIDGPLIASLGLLSSDGSYWISISGVQPNASGYRLVDVEAGQVTSFDSEPWDLAWLGDRYLVHARGGSAPGAVLDAATGDTSELPLSPSIFAYFYLDQIEK